ncbi:MAG: RNA 2',3'-cyclic phosphodiesterase [Clostridiales bacterium]|nr:RNA 2',3'-cyclic phosphodiesterase [Clostridiales bacterium]
MRVFIALNIPDKMRDNLERSASQFKDLATGGSFTKKDNYHVTLHFLGNVEQSNLIYVQSAMDKVKNLPAPRLAISQFAVLRASDIVCARFNKNANLTALHDALADNLEKMGFTVERRAYRPHVTMIRKYAFSLPFSEVTKNVTVYNKPFDAPEVVLYESVFKDNGVTYNPLYSISLPIEE